MAGYVKGSKEHHNILIWNLLDISEKLKSPEVSQEEKDELFIKQMKIADLMMRYFPNGQPR